MKNYVFFSVVLLVGRFAFATSISDTFKRSSDNSNNVLSGVYTLLPAVGDQIGFDAGLDYTTSNVKTTDIAGAAITDKSNEIDLSGAWSFPTFWYIGLGLDYGTDQTNNIESTQPSIYVKKKWLLGEPAPKKILKEAKDVETTTKESEPDNEEFIRSFYVKVEVGSNRIVQKQAGKRSPTLLEITQNSSRVTLGASPFEFLDVDASYKKYNYNRDIDQMVALLDSPQAARQFGPNFGTTLTSLSLNETTLNLILHFGVHWDLEGSTTWTKDAPIPQNTSLDQSLTLGYNASADWGLKIGTGQTLDSSTSTTSPYQTFTATYDF